MVWSENITSTKLKNFNESNAVDLRPWYKSFVEEQTKKSDVSKYFELFWTFFVTNVGMIIYTQQTIELKPQSPSEEYKTNLSIYLIFLETWTSFFHVEDGRFRVMFKCRFKNCIGLLSFFNKYSPLITPKFS